jgi:hypothetical protein
MYLKWLNFVLTVFFSILLSLVTFNYLMDPLWCFNHQLPVQNHQEGFNERQQKINLMTFQKFNYDSLMLGSSRVTVHNTSRIKSTKTFNLAINGMKQNEFNGYIEYAKKQNNKNFKYIILGLDFTALNDVDKIDTVQKYISTSSAPLYRYKALVSYDTFSISLKNFRNSAFQKYKKRFKTYNNNYIAITSPKNHHEVKKIINQSLENNRIKLSYDKDSYLEILNELKSNNPHSTFIVFTAPLPAPILSLILEDGNNQKVYHQWLQDLVQNFGAIHHFCFINPVTQDYSNFIDDGHYTSEVGDAINQAILDQANTIPKYKNFGMKLDQNNITTFINSMGKHNAF